MDRRQNGGQPSTDVWSRRDDPPEGNRAQRRFQEQGRGQLRISREFSGALYRRPDQASEAEAQAESRGRLRQRHRGCLRATGDGGGRLRGGAARYRARLYLSEIQSQSRRYGNAARHPRCGVVDNTGEEIFADKVGVMLARDMSAIHSNAQFVVDVKSTGLFATDPVLQKQGAKTVYWKTGHSYMKRRTNELGALAGFEKSGHFFFNKPFGRGYDDGLISAIAVCEMMDRAPGKSMADLRNALPKTWSSPTMSPHCADETKYVVVDAVVKHFEALQKSNG